MGSVGIPNDPEFIESGKEENESKSFVRSKERSPSAASSRESPGDPYGHTWTSIYAPHVTEKDARTLRSEISEAAGERSGRADGVSAALRK